MGLLMFREPDATPSKPICAKPDPTAAARSTIRRQSSARPRSHSSHVTSRGGDHGHHNNNHPHNSNSNSNSSSSRHQHSHQHHHSRRQPLRAYYPPAQRWYGLDDRSIQEFLYLESNHHNDPNLRNSWAIDQTRHEGLRNVEARDPSDQLRASSEPRARASADRPERTYRGPGESGLRYEMSVGDTSSRRDSGYDQPRPTLRQSGAADLISRHPSPYQASAPFIPAGEVSSAAPHSFRFAPAHRFDSTSRTPLRQIDSPYSRHAAYDRHLERYEDYGDEREREYAHANSVGADTSLLHPSSLLADFPPLRRVSRIRSRSRSPGRVPFVDESLVSVAAPIVIDGLGDRRRSYSPEEPTWETLSRTMTPDSRLPSAESSFTSANGAPTAAAAPSVSATALASRGSAHSSQSFTSREHSYSSSRSLGSHETALTTPPDSTAATIHEFAHVCDEFSDSSSISSDLDEDDLDDDDDDDDDDDEIDGEDETLDELEEARAVATAAARANAAAAMQERREVHANANANANSSAAAERARSRARARASQDRELRQMHAILDRLERQEHVPDELWASAGLVRLGVRRGARSDRQDTMDILDEALSERV